MLAGMEVWYSEWRLEDDGITFSIGDHVTMNVMPCDRSDELAALVGAEQPRQSAHEVFDSDDADPFITVRGRIHGLCEVRLG